MHVAGAILAIAGALSAYLPQYGKSAEELDPAVAAQLASLVPPESACNIDRVPIDTVDMATFRREYLDKRPLILTEAWRKVDYGPFAAETTREALDAVFSESASRAFSSRSSRD